MKSCPGTLHRNRYYFRRKSTRYLVPENPLLDLGQEPPSSLRNEDCFDRTRSTLISRCEYSSTLREGVSQMHEVYPVPPCVARCRLLSHPSPSEHQNHS